jgi:hypothetical protein
VARERRVERCAAALARAFAVYRDPSSPAPDRTSAREALRQALTVYLDGTAILVLGIGPAGFRAGSPPAPAGPSGEDSLAAVLHGAGLRQVSFLAVPDDPGLDRLLAALAIPPDAAGELDLATRLWECEVPEVRWLGLAPERMVKPATAGSAEGPPWPACGTPTRVRSRGSVPTPHDDAEDVDDWTVPRAAWNAPTEYESPAFTELERLRFELEGQTGDEGFHRGLVLMGELIEREPGAVELRDTVENAGRLVSAMLESGQLSLARRVLAQAQDALHRRGAAGVLSASERDPLWSLLVRSESIGRGVQAWKARTPNDPAELLALIDELEEPSTDALCEVLLHAEQAKVRRHACQRLIQVVATCPDRLRPWLARPEWFLARNLAYVLANIPSPDAEAMLLFLARHADARVRRECVAGLADCHSSGAREALVALCEDADGANRVAALRALRLMRDPVLAGALHRRIQGRMFAQLPAEERAALVETLGHVGGPDQVALLEAALTDFSPLDRRDSDAVADAAARGLAALATESAQRVLERALKSWSRPVKRAAERVLADAPKEAQS